MRRRRAVILPVVLVLVGLLALTMAGFVFFVRAETAGTIAYGDGQQARLAAESGFEEVTLLLRENPHDVSAWYDVPERFRHALVWGDGFDRESDPLKDAGSREELFEAGAQPAAAWRYSVVAEALDGLPDTMRYGITPESAKLNLNVATEQQITQLLEPILIDLEVDNPHELIAALLDWRDTDDDVRPGGAENEYYSTLEPPYETKKTGSFDTVEELLLVKGFTAAVLYGEDVNRNGFLDANEDDGDASFPYYDNGDGVLNRGIAPYLTVWSRESDTALDNKPRIKLIAGAETVAAQISEHFQEGELTEATIQFLTGLDEGVVSRLNSPADLFVGDEPAEAGDTGDDPNNPGSGSTPVVTDSPITLDELPYIMDRFSVRPEEQALQPILGLININAAPGQVLVLIPGMTSEAAGAIIDMRQQLEPKELETTAWPLVSGAVDVATFRAIAPYITTKAHQFRAEVVGYADHVKTMRRYEWVFEMVGPVAQIKYHRELTSLGPAWPLDDETVIVTGQ